MKIVKIVHPQYVNLTGLLLKLKIKWIDNEINV